MKKKYKIFLSIIIFLLIIIFIFFKNYNSIINLIPTSLKNTKLLMDLHFNYFVPVKRTINAVQNQNYFYNVEFLPNTHFASLNLDILNFKKTDALENDGIFDKNETQRFFLDIFENKTILTTLNGNLFFTDNKELSNGNLELENLNSNFKEKFSTFSILDTLIDKNEMFISAFEEITEKNNKICKKFRLFKGNFNFKKIIFKEIYHIDECKYGFMQGGRMQLYNLNGKSGLLFTTGANIIDEPDSDPQSDLSEFGKIIFLNFLTNKTEIFTKGHRNPQGLLVNGDIILSTEHGPKGGDEINRIIQGENYGWPISSYGSYYNTNKKDYFKSHFKYNFKEPLYNYVPAIGISEIIKVPNNFIKQENLDNIYFVTSLKGRSLFLIKLSSDHERIIFSEKIFINKMIRDIKYIKEYDLFVLALNYPSEIAILKNNKN